MSIKLYKVKVKHYSKMIDRGDGWPKRNDIVEFTALEGKRKTTRVLDSWPVGKDDFKKIFDKIKSLENETKTILFSYYEMEVIVKYTH